MSIKSNITNPVLWGRRVQNAVGATLLKQLQGFLELHPQTTPFIVGKSGVPPEEFFETPMVGLVS